jgi:hypothetical protein
MAQALKLLVAFALGWAAAAKWWEPTLEAADRESEWEQLTLDGNW